jgi:hypothetical protein
MLVSIPTDDMNMHRVRNGQIYAEPDILSDEQICDEYVVVADVNDYWNWSSSEDEN